VQLLTGEALAGKIFKMFGKEGFRPETPTYAEGLGALPGLHRLGNENFTPVPQHAGGLNARFAPARQQRNFPPALQLRQEAGSLPVLYRPGTQKNARIKNYMESRNGSLNLRT